MLTIGIRIQIRLITIFTLAKLSPTPLQRDRHLTPTFFFPNNQYIRIVAKSAILKIAILCGSRSKKNTLYFVIAYRSKIYFCIQFGISSIFGLRIFLSTFFFLGKKKWRSIFVCLIQSTKVRNRQIYYCESIKED